VTPPVTAVCPYNIPIPNRKRTATSIRKRCSVEFIVEPPWTTAFESKFAPGLEAIERMQLQGHFADALKK
jgi:hypothetical protein